MTTMNYIGIYMLSALIIRTSYKMSVSNHTIKNIRKSQYETNDHTD